MLKRIKYVSVATQQFTPAALDELLSKARASNSARDVTGALMVSGSVFFQMLEGPVASVDEIYARIARDPRHGYIQLLRSDVSDGPRMFGEWSMRLMAPEDIVLRDNFAVRVEMERLEMLHRSVRQISEQLEQRVWNHFAAVAA